jgi:hypothetical protein
MVLKIVVAASEWVRADKISLVFATSSVGVKGNEPADQLADILNAIRDAGCSNNSPKYKESMTMKRLHEHLVKIGVARKEHFTGCQRKIVNQHR